METPKAKDALSLAAFIAVLLVGWYFWGPAGGKLTSLSENNFFAQEFDGAAGNERVLLLLSPT
jgi:hypothetical protein